MTSTYDVRVWATEKYTGTKVTTYRVVWVVAGKRWKKGHRTAAAAESFRSELLTAVRKGEAFDTETGRPLSQARAVRSSVTWYEFTCQYVDMKWRDASPHHRKAIAEALITVAPVMQTTQTSPEEAKRIRSALLNWAFNTRRRGSAEQPDDVTTLLAFVARSSRPLSDIAEPQVIRAVLDALATKLDGTRAAGRTATMKRVVLSNALSYAVELGLLESNPVEKVKSKTSRLSGAVDRRAVVNPTQAGALLAAVRETPRSGPRLVAFFGCIYYSALRPEEAANLRRHNLELPGDNSWGWIALDEAAPEIDRQWTDDGSRRVARELKHRARSDGRRVPVPPQLVVLLREHIAADPAPDDGSLLFRGERGKAISGLTYRNIWRRARAAALTRAQQNSPLAARPYDLRHAAVSTWLSAGVPAAQVAVWAGHSVDVLLRVYARCLDDEETRSLRRIDDALGGQSPRRLARESEGEQRPVESAWAKSLPPSSASEDLEME